MLPTTPPTETQQRYRHALRHAHLLELAAVEAQGYGYSPLATEKSQLLIELFHAGYLYSERGLFFLTEAGSTYLSEVDPSSVTTGEQVLPSSRTPC